LKIIENKEGSFSSQIQPPQKGRLFVLNSPPKLGEAALEVVVFWLFGLAVAVESPQAEALRSRGLATKNAALSASEGQPHQVNLILAACFSFF
jgi:hypothetical protein